MAKNLTLNIEIRGKNAEVALKGITRALREADMEEKKVKKSTKEATTEMKRQESQSRQSATMMDRFRSASQKAGSVMSTAFKGVSGILSGVASTVVNITKKLMTFGSILFGISTYQIGRNFLDFDKQFALMNATLKADLPDTIRGLKREIKNMSDETAVDMVSITDALTQMFSSGLSPTAPEGTAEYKKQLEDVLEIQKLIAQSAHATGNDVGEMGEAYVFAANALGKDPRNLDSARYIMDLFANTLDTGIGLMKEYSQQFVKFGKEAKQAGATNEEAFAIFSRLTKIMEPERAGFTAAAFFRELNQIPKNVTLASSRVKRAIKTGGMSAADVQTLTPFTDPAEWMDIFYSDQLDAMGSRVKKSLPEVIAGMKEVMSAAKPGSALYDSLMDALAPNVNMKRAIMDILSEEGFQDIFGEHGIFTAMEKTSSDMDNMGRKIEEVESSLSFRFTRTAKKFQNAFTDAIVELGPELDVLFGKIEEFLPKMQEGLSKVIEWVRSDDGKRFFEFIQDSFKALGGFAKLIFDVLVTIYNSPPFQALMWFMRAGAKLFGDMGGAYMKYGKPEDFSEFDPWMHWTKQSFSQPNTPYSQLPGSEDLLSPTELAGIQSKETDRIVNGLNQVIYAVNQQKLQSNMSVAVSVDEKGKTRIIPAGSGGSQSAIPGAVPFASSNMSYAR